MNQPNLIILHGAVGAATQFEVLRNLLESDYNITLLDFEGHGKKGDSDRPFRIEHFAENLLAHYQEEGISKACLFGYSMGGYVALYFASQYPDKVQKVFTLATKFAWDPKSAEKEGAVLDPEKILEKVPGFAQSLEERHRGDWKEVCTKTREMMHHLGQTDLLRTMDLGSVEIPVTIGRGEEDDMVTEAESVEMTLQLPNASFMKFPQTGHPIEKVDKEMLARALKEFFGEN